MLTLNQAYELLKLAENVDPNVYGNLIEIEEGDRYSAECGTLSSIITISEQDQKFENDMVSWLQRHNDLKDHELMFNNFIDVFSFYHELGHIITSYQVENDEVYYSNYKNKVHFSRHTAFKEYREIPTERLADCKAMELIRGSLPQIYMMMHDISEEKALEWIEFWSMV